MQPVARQNESLEAGVDIHALQKGEQPMLTHKIPAWQCRGVAWLGMVWCGMAWCCVAWRGVVWHGMVWCGVAWCGADGGCSTKKRFERTPQETQSSPRHPSVCGRVRVYCSSFEVLVRATIQIPHSPAKPRTKRVSSSLEPMFTYILTHNTHTHSLSWKTQCNRRVVVVGRDQMLCNQ